ncbi:hypothetical protein ACQY1Q_07665 [Tenacibaculum sp. TC6]|uniref:hypothetical protein n=1 Tax=Tenacibaculum sp. TC6 TaxID=3423223 RepID=UPI003D361235
MKNLFIILLLTSSFLKAQEGKQDTIFFKYDKNYVLFYDDYKKWWDLSYKDYENEILKNINLTNTQGYFMLKAVDTLYNLFPKKVFSLKKYVETRKFYYPGKYNKIVDINILKKELFNKYKVFFTTDDNGFIKIRQSPYENYYHSFYPIKYANKKKYPKQIKDTLFIKYDKDIFLKRRNPVSREISYLIKDRMYRSSEYIRFEEKKKYTNISKKTEPINFQDFLVNNFNDKIDDWTLSSYLSNYVIFFVCEKTYIKMQVIDVIDD